MKSEKNFFCLLIGFTLFVMSSCVVEKRHYLGGYYFEKKNNQQHPEKIINPNPHKEVFTASSGKGIIVLDTNDLIETIFNDCDTIILKNGTKIPAKIIEVNLRDIKMKDCSGSSQIITTIAKKEIETIYFEKSNTNIKDSCDKIIQSNGEELKVKIVEILDDEVKYKKCENLNGPIFNFPKTLIKSITYSNGKQEDFSAKKIITSDIGTIKFHPLAVFSLIFAIASMTIVVSYLLGGIFAVLSIVLGEAAYLSINERPNKFKGKKMALYAMVIAGVVLSAIFAAFVGGKI